MKQNNSKITHVIVGSSAYEREGPIYRQHRLTNYLSKNISVKKVIYIYPEHKPKALLDLKINEVNKRTLEISVVNAGRPVSFFNKYLFDERVINKLENIFRREKSNQMILWYTVPVFPSLIKFKDLWDGVVYDCSDNYSQPPRSTKDLNRFNFPKRLFMKLNYKFRDRTEKKLLKKIDLGFASSEFLRNKLKNNTQAPVFLVETGVDFEKFSSINNYIQIPIFEKIPKPRIGFTGVMKTNIDFNLLSKVAKNNPKWSIVLIGPKTKNTPNAFFELVDENPNVYWLGKIQSEQVPDYLNHLDVGLMPYKDIEYNKAVFPLKFNEYLACGLPVVGCGLPSTKKHIQDKVYLHTNNDYQEFSKACRRALSGDSEDIRRTIAKKSDWQKKFGYMLKRVLKTIR